MLKRLGKSKLAHEAPGFILAAYVRLVWFTVRKKVEDGLDDVHRRAYAKFGAADPGAGLRRD